MVNLSPLSLSIIFIYSFICELIAILSGSVRFFVSPLFYVKRKKKEFSYFVIFLIYRVETN